MCVQTAETWYSLPFASREQATCLPSTVMILPSPRLISRVEAASLPAKRSRTK